MPHRPALPAAALAAGLLLAACGGGSDSAAPVAPVGAGDAEVRLVGLEFEPEEVTVAPGTRVVWTWTDSLVHNVKPTSEPGFAGIGNVSGPAHDFRFERPGTYRYTCTLHRGMDGVVTVR